MFEYCIVSRSQALKGDFPLNFDYALLVKQSSCKQVIMCSLDTAKSILPIISELVDVRSVKILHVEDFDDEL